MCVTFIDKQRKRQNLQKKWVKIPLKNPIFKEKSLKIAKQAQNRNYLALFIKNGLSNPFQKMKITKTSNYRTDPFTGSFSAMDK